MPPRMPSAETTIDGRPFHVIYYDDVEDPTADSWKLEFTPSGLKIDKNNVTIGSWVYTHDDETTVISESDFEAVFS